jgi:hypothetical protein
MFTARVKFNENDDIQTKNFNSVEDLKKFYKDNHLWWSELKWVPSEQLLIYDLGEHISAAVSRTEELEETDPHLTNVGRLSLTELQQLKVYIVRGRYHSEEWYIDDYCAFKILLPNSQIDEWGFTLYSREEICPKDIFTAQTETERLAALNAEEAFAVESLLAKLTTEEIKFLKNSLKSTLLRKVDWYKFLD